VSPQPLAGLNAAGAVAFRAARQFLPPLLSDWLRFRFSEFTFAGTAWPRPPSGGGWEHESIVEAQVRHWPLLKRNLEDAGPLGVSHLPGHDGRADVSDHNIIMSYAYALARALSGRRTLSVLDWGGGLGHYLLYSRALFPGVDFQYHCLDLPAMCAAGRRLQPDACFHDDARELVGLKLDLVISSSSLHYFEDWRGTLRDIAAMVGGWLYLSRLQCVEQAPAFVAVQRPRSAGYGTSYPSWFLNRRGVLAAALAEGLALEREFLFDERWYVRRAPEQGRSRGFLFRKP
jgi:putative methyltransferase (TIGR04325 family)